MRICMELTFVRKKLAVFPRKCIKIYIKFKKPYPLCVCCILTAFPSFLEPVLGDLLLNSQCDVMSRTKETQR